jgi:hypothetical protein
MYILVELQTNGGQTANLVTAYDNEPQAWQAFYAGCSAGAVSSVERHAFVLLKDTGITLDQRCFDHGDTK